MTCTIKQKKEMLRAFEQIAGGMYKVEKWGICSNWQRMVPDCTQEQVALFRVLMRRACKGWKHYSGNEGYPIKFLEEPDEGWSQTNWHSGYHTLPKWSGEYGKLRYELVARLIAQLKREMSRNHRSMRVSLKKKINAPTTDVWV